MKAPRADAESEGRFTGNISADGSLPVSNN